MTVLVIGATGRVAAHLTKRLCADGVPVRALVRSPAKAAATFAGIAEPEILAGAFDDQTVLRKAFDNIEVAFLALGTSLDQIRLEKGLVDAAAQAGLPHLVRLSVLDPDVHGPYEVARKHGALDEHLRASGVPHTLLRPAYFSSNLLAAAPSIAEHDRWIGTAPSGRVAIIDACDVADAAAAVIQDRGLRNAVYHLTGSAALTFPQVAEHFSAVLGRRISYVAVDEPAVRQSMAARGVPDWLVDVALGIDAAVRADRHAAVTGELRRLIGAPPRTVEDFIRDHRAAFTRRT